MYRVAIIGGRRGLHHASAYPAVAGRAQIVALAELDPARCQEASASLEIPGYVDWEEMLRQERPDVVHAVTTPLVPRAQWIAPVAAAGVRLLVIEKPLALSPNEGAALASAIHQTGLKVVVNHQRRYMPFANALLDGHGQGRARLGQAHFIRGSTIGKVLDMAPHLVDLSLMALGDPTVTRVWAAADGLESSAEYPGPRRLLAEFATSSGARLHIEATPELERTFGTNDFAADYPDFMPGYGPHRCNLDLWAEHGRCWWREYGSWGLEVSGQPAQGAPTAFKRDDLPAQMAFTTALYDWLDGGPPHRCRFELAYQTFTALLAAIGAAHAGHAVDLPPAGLDQPPPLSQHQWEAAIAWLATTDREAS